MQNEKSVWLNNTLQKTSELLTLLKKLENGVSDRKMLINALSWIE